METCLQENCMKTAQKVSGIVFASGFNFVPAKKGLSSHFAELTVLQTASKRREEELKSAQQQGGWVRDEICPATEKCTVILIQKTGQLKELKGWSYQQQHRSSWVVSHNSELSCQQPVDFILQVCVQLLPHVGCVTACIQQDVSSGLRSSLGLFKMFLLCNKEMCLGETRKDCPTTAPQRDSSAWRCPSWVTMPTPFTNCPSFHAKNCWTCPIPNFPFASFL